MIKYDDFSKSQQKAIDATGNILVSAAAGSGKTAVLVERIIRKMTNGENPIDANRFLVVTFTNAAAAEMRGRIEKRLYEEIKSNRENKNLLKQKMLLAGADICTIDSFCISKIRENFAEFGISPDFKMSNGDDLTEINNEVLNSIITPYFENKDEAFLRLLTVCGCEYDLEKFKETVNGIFTYAMNRPFPKKVIGDLVKPYETDIDDNHPWIKGFMKRAQNLIEDIVNSLVLMLDEVPYLPSNNEKVNEYLQERLDIYSNLKDIISSGDYQNSLNNFRAIETKRFPTVSNDSTNESYNIYCSLKDRYQGALKTLKDIFYDDITVIEEQKNYLYPAVKLLVLILDNYYEGLFEKYREENVLTFAFAEQLMCNLICSFEDGKLQISDKAKEIIGLYDEVLVDEYQDINDLQYMLFYVLSNREEHLFTVGDVKQSIYGFRGSNPQNFINRKISCKDKNSSAIEIPLSENYRSRKGVCETVNYFFSLLMAGQCGSLVYEKEDELQAKQEFPETETAESDVLIVDSFDSDEDRINSEAKAITGYIQNLMKEGKTITEKDQMRQITYSDIAILLSAVSKNGSIIADKLSSAGIPVSFSAEAYLETDEISFMMALLKIIDNPKHDVSLLGVLMSPVFAFSPDDMARIRIKSKYGSLYSALLLSAQSGDGKAEKFVRTLSDLRKFAAVNSVGETVNKIFETTDLPNIYSAMSSGGARRENLFTFLRLAFEYSTSLGGGIYGFLKYLSMLPEKAVKSASVSDGGVKIMTMHASKGLQFPVCILANLAGKFNNKDQISRILYDDENGIVFNYFNYQTDEDIKTLGHRSAEFKAKIKSAEEELRKLYVAATRAIDRVCFVCTVSNAEDKIKSVSSRLISSSQIDKSAFLSATCMADWILNCSVLHKDFEKLGKMFEIRINSVLTDSKINFSLINVDNEPISNTETENTLFADKENEIAKKMNEIFGFKYPYSHLCDIPAKVSVSTAANGEEAERFAFSTKPAFMLSGGLDAAGKGTAMHHVMQYIDFSKPDGVDGEIKRLLDMKFITESEAGVIDIPAIKSFFESSLYSRIVSADKTDREMRFLTEMPANEVLKDKPDAPKDVNILVQGAVDLCFEENGEIVVVDFKTDKVDDINILKDRYAAQLEIYSKACEKIMQKPVKERIIYSFCLSKFVTL